MSMKTKREHDTTLVTFENHSVSGIDRMYGRFRLRIPGHSIKDKAVTLPVPNGLIEDIASYLKRNHPAVIVVVSGGTFDDADGSDTVNETDLSETGDSAAAGETNSSSSDESAAEGDALNTQADADADASGSVDTASDDTVNETDTTADDTSIGKEETAVVTEGSNLPTASAPAGDIETPATATPDTKAVAIPKAPAKPGKKQNKSKGGARK